MKKTIVGIIIILLISLGVSCAANYSLTDTSENVEDKDRDNEYICYYGCPNSKRVKKLFLEKKRLK